MKPIRRKDIVKVFRTMRKAGFLAKGFTVSGLSKEDLVKEFFNHVDFACNLKKEIPDSIRQFHDELIINEVNFSRGFIIVPKVLARKYGISEAAFLSELVSKRDYWKERNRLDSEGWFFCTVDDMKKSTGLSRTQQERIRKFLKDKGDIDFKVKGVPARLHYKILMPTITSLPL